mmetsp:Transcript_16208/g.63203  ORF Transcript_16208/g.63203 Transcript_16208/m.63203 type:complete len:321 (-) Transcript_16208:1577-2539(-)
MEPSLSVLGLPSSMNMRSLVTSITEGMQGGFTFFSCVRKLRKLLLMLKSTSSSCRIRIAFIGTPSHDALSRCWLMAAPLRAEKMDHALEKLLSSTHFSAVLSSCVMAWLLADKVGWRTEAARTADSWLVQLMKLTRLGASSSPFSFDQALSSHSCTSMCLNCACEIKQSCSASLRGFRSFQPPSWWCDCFCASTDENCMLIVLWNVLDLASSSCQPPPCGIFFTRFSRRPRRATSESPLGPTVLQKETRPSWSSLPASPKNLVLCVEIHRLSSFITLSLATNPPVLCRSMSASSSSLSPMISGYIVMNVRWYSARSMPQS